MKITLETIASGLVPVDTLREFVRPYGDRDMIGLHDEEAHLAGEAMATRRDGLDERLGQRLGIAGDAVIGVAGKARHGKERRVGKAA